MKEIAMDKIFSSTTAYKFGKRLKYLRQIKKMTQTMLADRVGLSNRQISRIELGQASPQFALLDKLCQALETNIVQLFLFQDDQDPKFVLAAMTSQKNGDIPVRTMFQPSFIGLWSINRVTDEMKWSPSIYEFLAYSRYSTKPTLKRFLNRVHREDKKLLETFIYDIRQNKYSGMTIIRVKSRKSSNRTVLILNEPSSPEADLAGDCWLVILDVTELLEIQNQFLLNRDQLEEAIKAKNSELFKIIDEFKRELELRKQAEEALLIKDMAIKSSLDAIAIADMKGKVTYVNPAFLDLWGIERLENVLGRSIKCFWDDEQEADKIIQTFMEKGCLAQELAFRKENGQLMHIFLSASIIRNHEGEPVSLMALFREITESKREKEKLRKSEELLASVLSTQHEMICRFLPDTTLTYVNDAYCRVFEMSADELVGRKYLELVPSSEHEAILKKMSTLDADNPAANYIHQVILNDGSIAWQEWTDHVILDSKNRVVEFQSVGRDITRQKMAEEEVQNQRWRLENIIEGTDVGTWEWNVQTGETVFNETWARIIGYTLDELSPVSIKTWGKFTHPEDLKKSNQLLNRHFAGELPYYDCECRMKHKDGHWVWVQDRGRLITRTSDGKPLLMFGTHANITERKQAEEKLRESEIKNRTILSAIPDLMFIYSREGVYLDYHASDMSLLAVEPEKFLGQSIRKILPPAVAEQFIQSFEAVHKAKQTVIIKYALTVIDGLKYFEGRVTPMGDNRQLVIVRDITQRKQAEDTIRQTNQQLQTALAERDKFFSIIAHDLRSPFIGFLTLIRMLAEASRNLSLEEIQMLAGNIKDSAENLYNLLENLLEWSLMQRNGVACTPVECCLADMVRENISLVQSYAVQKDITIKSNVPENLHVLAEKSMLNIILRNLFSNAVKFSMNSGIVTISASRRDSMVLISVEDKGLGMDQKTLSGLFTLDQVTSKKGTAGEKGTGLGLLLCKEYVNKHGGNIWAESNPDQGTKVCVALPGLKEKPTIKT